MDAEEGMEGSATVVGEDEGSVVEEDGGSVVGEDEGSVVEENGGSVVEEDRGRAVEEGLKKGCPSEVTDLEEKGRELVTPILLVARSNVFVLYKCQSNATTTYTLSARFHVEEVEEDIIEHLQILQTSKGRFQLQGQANEYDDVASAVNSYITGRQPPLTPLFEKSFQLQLRDKDEPPRYSHVVALDRALPQYMATIDTAKEAKTGNLSPNSVRGHREMPAEMNNPHWYRYQDLCCLHPKNCYHCCCYRDSYWDGTREAHEYSELSLRGKGPLRTLGVLLFLLVAGPFIGCVFCALCLFCCMVEYYTED